MEFGEAFGAIAALQQEGLPRRDLRQIGLERARLARKDQWRVRGERLLRSGQSAGVFVVRQMPRLEFRPAVGRPRLRHHRSIHSPHGIIAVALAQLSQAERTP